METKARDWKDRDLSLDYNADNWLTEATQVVHRIHRWLYRKVIDDGQDDGDDDDETDDDDDVCVSGLACMIITLEVSQAENFIPWKTKHSP